jgi:hypothetical protein
MIAQFAPAGAARADTYQIDIRTDVEKGHAEGKLALRYQNRGERSLAGLRLRLDPNLSPGSAMNVASVRDQEGNDLPWRYVPFAFGQLKSDRSQLEVDLPKPLEAGSELELHLVYSLDAPGLLNKTMLTFQDDPYHSFDAWYPKAMTHTGDAWSINDDRMSRYDVTIELADTFPSVASTGKVVRSAQTELAARVFQLQADNVRGFTVYASPSWEEHRRTAEGVDLGVHLPAEAREWAPRILEAAADVIAFYREEYGEYPGDHLEIICPGTLQGRAHGSSATCHGITVWLHDRFEEQYRWLIAHEVAHQYLGASLGIVREEIAWAPIGVAMTMDHRYMTQRGLDLASIRKTMRWFYLEAGRRGFDTRLSQPVEAALRADPPWSSGWNMSLMHGKAYEVCAMLEDLLGAAAFRDVVRKVLKDRQGGLLSGPDFIEHCAQASDEPLDWFVDEWIDGNLKLDYGVTDVNPEKGTVEISRIGAASFPLVVEVQEERGKKLRQRIDRKQAVHRLTFATSSAIQRVVIDPEGLCPDVDDSNNTWPERSAKPQ